MRNKFIIRKDLTIDVNRFARICIDVGQKIEQHGKDGKKTDVLEAMYSRELDELEEHFINEGMFFEWIIEGGTYVGILALADDEIVHLPEFLEPFKIYDPDKKKSNLADVKEEFLLRKNGNRPVEVEIETF